MPVYYRFSVINSASANNKIKNLGHRDIVVWDCFYCAEPHQIPGSAGKPLGSKQKAGFNH